MKKTIAIRSIRRSDLVLGQIINPPVDVPRPRVRADCVVACRPCPWVSCKYHLYLDVDPDTGAIKVNFPDREPWELNETCALDVADRGAQLFSAVAGLMNVTCQGARAIAARGLDELEDQLSG